MSLGKLLTAGKSLMGLHNSGARYQLRTGALPKFESQKNPFAVRPHNEEPSANSDQLTPAEIAAASLKDTQRLPLLTPKPEASEESIQPAQPGENHARPDTSPGKGWDEVVLGVQGAGRKLPPEGGTPNRPEVPSAIDGWLKKLNPLVWWENRKPTQPKSAIPRFDKAPVQGELSLDNIKVMRNDLSDADVEIVPMKARPAKAPIIPPLGAEAGAAAAAMAIPELPPAKNAWEFLGERLLGKH